MEAQGDEESDRSCLVLGCSDGPQGASPGVAQNLRAGSQGEHAFDEGSRTQSTYQDSGRQGTDLPKDSTIQGERSPPASFHLNSYHEFMVGRGGEGKQEGEELGINPHHPTLFLQLSGFISIAAPMPPTSIEFLGV